MSVWPAARRHAMTLLMVGLYCALVAPTIATVLLAVRGNGLRFDAVFSLVLAPLAVLYAGPAAFLLGLVFGWMMLVLTRVELNLLPVRVGVAMLVATLAWALSEPLPAEAGGAGAAARGLGDWTVWCATAALTSLIFTRGWWDRRILLPEIGD